MFKIPSRIVYGAALAESDAYYAARASQSSNPVAAAEIARIEYYAAHGYVALTSPVED